MPHFLKNPHSVLAVLETRPKDIIQVTVPARASNDAWEMVIKLARTHGIPISTSAPKTAKVQRDSANVESQRLGAAEASIKEKGSVPLEDLFSQVDPASNQGGLWIALDSLQDPHNVGAIFRAAAFFGVKGIILTQERSTPITSVVYDVASGGVEYVPFTIQVNLQRALEAAKKAGMWILGASEHAPSSYKTIPRDRSWLLVLGNEEKGMRRLTEESCDMLCKVDGVGKVTSLNVSVAAGVLISHLVN